MTEPFQRTSSTAANNLLSPQISLQRFEVPSKLTKNVGVGRIWI